MSLEQPETLGLAAHLDVADNHVQAIAKTLDLRARVIQATCLGDDAEVRLRGERSNDAVEDDGVIVDDEDGERQAAQARERARITLRATRT